MSELTIIKFNDDIHDERVWINGEYAGGINNTKNIIKKTLEIINRGEEYKCIDDIQEIKQRTVYLCDDFEDVDDDEVVDEIGYWLNTTEYITPKQIDAIFKNDWEKLLELIKEER